MGAEFIEDENHVLQKCDLYAGIRAKLIARLNNTPDHQCESISQLTMNHELLNKHFMTLLSPYSITNNENVNIYNIHHNSDTANNESFQHRRSYIINCLSTFICHSLEKRQKYIKDTGDNQTRINTLTMHFNSIK